MLNKKSTKLKIFSLIFSLAFLTILPVSVLAQTAAPAATDPCKVFEDQFKVGNTNIVANLPKFCNATDVATTAINLGFGFAGTVAILFIMIGGYFYIAGAGNEEQAEKGKKILINSVLGLTVITMSFAIVKIVSSLLTK